MKRVILGTLSILLLAATLYLYSGVLSGRISLAADPGATALPPVMIYFTINSLLIFGLMIFCLVYLVTSRSLSSTQKWLWGLLLLILNVFVMPVFIFAHVMPENKAATAPGN